MNGPPWEREWLDVTPQAFEKIVVDFIRGLDGTLEDFEVTHSEKVAGPDGEFVLDAVARFTALGVNFVVIVECKHHKNPIKRELVQVLRDKVRSLGAHKAIMFSTANFQSGAIDYASNQGIALIHLSRGGPTFHTRAYGVPVGPPRDREEHWVCRSAEGKVLWRYGAYDDLSEYLFGAKQDDK